MISNRVRSLLVSVTTLAATFIAFQPTASAGPPLICHAIAIGNAQSLPWNDVKDPGWDISHPGDYNLKHLPADTLALLSPETPVLVRMETLRRATLYTKDNPAIAAELLRQLEARAQKESTNSSGPEPSQALALFDAGYLKESYGQVLPLSSPAFRAWAEGQTSITDGYPQVLRAISLRGGDPAMEFAAALMTMGHNRGDHERHLRRAVAGATDGSLLARNLLMRFNEHGNTLAELRASFNGPPK